MDSMHRPRRALVLLLAFIACTGAAILAGAGRPADDPGVVPWVLQVVAYLCAIAAGVLLRTSTGAGRVETEGRRLGAVLLPVVLALVLLDMVTAASAGGGANIGAGLARMVLLVVVGMLTARLAVTAAAERRTR